MKPEGSRSWAIVVIGLVACSMLMYEILLTRVAALRLMFHFAYLVIGNCLLGIGASGSLIFVFQDRMRARIRWWTWLLSLLYVVSLIVAYAFLITFGIDHEMTFRSNQDILTFTLFNLVAAVPFFFGGGAIGWILTVNAARVHRFYFSDLIGAGLGCWLCPLALARFGAGGCLVLLALIGLVAVVVAAPASLRRRSLVAGAIAGALGLALLPSAESFFPVPGKGVLDITSTVSARVAGQIEQSRWSAAGRIDMVPIPEGERLIYARGTAAAGIEIPEEWLILQDGSAGTYILNYSEQPEGLELLRRSMYATATRLRPGARVFIIGAGGGNDLWTAKIHGASSITAVELHQPILDVHTQVLPHFSKDLLEDDRITWINGEGRSALMREEQAFDVIQMTGVDTWTSLTSGAYVLAENYLYTTEALETMYTRLADDGIIQIIRFAADMEALRLLSNIQTTFERLGVEGLERSVVCLRTQDQLMAFLIRKGPFTADELDEVRRFAGESGIEIAYLPGAALANLPTEFIRTADKASFTRDFPRDISPTTDDRPYFFNFSRWRNPLASAEYVWEPTVISQGNPLFILGQLVLSVLLAATLIVLPLTRVRDTLGDRTDLRRTLIYFAALGLGFIAIEIALIQKLTLFLGHPIYSLTVTLFVMLVFTGLGSLLSERWFVTPGPRGFVVPAGLTVFVGLFLWIHPWLVESFIGLSLSARIAITVALLAPIGLLLGVPFAYGVRILDRTNPKLVAWAWAINAALTVIGSILTVVLSMNFGFRAVIVTALVVYWIGFAALPGRGSTSA